MQSGYETLEGSLRTLGCNRNTSRLSDAPREVQVERSTPNDTNVSTTRSDGSEGNSNGKQSHNEVRIRHLLPDFGWTPQVLVLGPGGFRGYAELGTLQVLKDKGKLEQVRHIIGCSVGSIIAMLMICGYSFEEILEISVVDEQLVRETVQTSIKLDRLTEGLKEHSGLLNTKILQEVLEKLLRNKFGVSDITLRNFYQVTQYNFILTVYNKTLRQTEFLSHVNSPDLSVIEAVMMSCNIPGLFYRISHNNCIYMDGALGNPYPVDHLDDGKLRILGIYIDEVEYIGNGIIETIQAALMIPLVEHRKRIIQQVSSSVRHISLPCQGGFFGIITEKCNKENLLQIGRQAAEQFIQSLRRGTFYKVPEGKIPIIDESFFIDHHV